MQTASATIAALGRAIDDVLSPLLPVGTRCALLDFPNYSNVGDSAIWLAEVAWLERRGCPIVYACDTATYSAEQMAARAPDVILMQGGGNFGDLWVEHQRFREWVIQSCPDRRIILMPQTTHFEWPENVAEARRVFSAHKDLTILCRDNESLDFVKREVDGRCLLCPDMVFALGPLARPAPPDVDVLWLGRTDAEAQGSQTPPLPGNAARVDWLEEPPTPLRERNHALSRRLEHSPPDWPAVLDAVMGTYGPLANERLERGCRLLARGRVVVTDRLHGHVLCLLLGIPHVVMDNNYRKVGRFFQTWTRDCALGCWAGTTEEADRLARLLLPRSG